jgi:hypothetical protein
MKKVIGPRVPYFSFAPGHFLGRGRDLGPCLQARNNPLSICNRTILRRVGIAKRGDFTSGARNQINLNLFAAFFTIKLVDFVFLRISRLHKNQHHKKEVQVIIYIMNE